MPKNIIKSCKLLLVMMLVISTLFAGQLTGKAAAATQYTTTADLNVRTGPSTSYKVAFTLKKNSIVTYQSKSGIWFKIKSGTKTGYASSKYLKATPKKNASNTTANTAGTTTDITAPKQATYFYVTEPTGLTLRSGAGVGFKSLNVSVPFEAKVQILAENKNNWIQVSYANKKGWINADALYGFKSTKNITFTAQAMQQKKYLVMKQDYLNVRKLPSVDAPTIGKARKGFSAQILRISNSNWVEVQYSSKEKGWISANTSYGVISSKVDPVGNDVTGTLTGLTFVVDAGHGGGDSGSYGTDLYGNRVYEKTLNLKAAQAIQQAIEEKGGTVLAVRNSDVFYTLKQRAEYAKYNGGNAFISVHHNSASSPSASGYETFYSDKTNSRAFASAIHENVVDSIQEEYPNYKDRKLKAVDYYVVRYNSVFATLLELGFMSNKTEVTRANTDKFRSAVADGVVNGLLQYYGR